MVNKKYGKFPAEVAEETPRNKPCVDLITHNKILCRGKDALILKVVTVIDPVTGWFEAMQYRDKKSMTVTNLVETTWLVRYHWPLYITYDQLGEILGSRFKISL